MKFKKIIINSLWLLLVLFLLSCSPQKRINRILKKNPHLLHKDTARVIDTVKIITPAVEADSLIPIEILKLDTVFITEENLTIKTFIRNDTLYVHGKCDTLIIEKVREVLVPYETPVFHKARDKLRWDDISTLLRIFYFFIVFIVIMLIIRLFIK